MIGLIQRVRSAHVDIDNQTVGRIGRGILALIGVQPHDTTQNAVRLLERMLNYRIFPDDEGKMNLSLRDINGGLLLVPQFTLAADTRKGNRPSFTSAAPPAQGQKLFAFLCEYAHEQWPHMAQGQFGADMQVSLVNDGPVTFWLEVPPSRT
ncbi:MAG: D-tyrosyl-tRNA(Tyr) deacylase [Gammaproteobacteria bacterium]|nr:MAG: D-tyrosyl-tRNA(Tyr) deacylase [Gammaproteobacteria bacterium]